METKKDIRAKALARRESLTREEAEEKSRRIAERVTGHPWFQTAEVLLAYLPVRREVRTKLLIEEAWVRKKKVYVPVVRGREMEFCRLDLFSVLREGRYHIPEPQGGELLNLETLPADRVLVLMPGAAFDLQGGRAGYGGGYYDRYFSHWKDAHRMALAFECQLVERVPVEEHDISPHVIVTENRIVEI